MCDPILATLLKMQPHYCQSSRQNATPCSGTLPLASYNKMYPPPPPIFSTKEDTLRSLVSIKQLLAANKLSLNIAKTEYIPFGSISTINALPERPQIFIDNDPAEQVRKSKALGVHIDEPLTWKKHIDEIIIKISCAIGAIGGLYFRILEIAKRQCLYIILWLSLTLTIATDSLGFTWGWLCPEIAEASDQVCKGDEAETRLVMQALGWISPWLGTSQTIKYLYRRPARNQ